MVHPLLPKKKEGRGENSPTKDSRIEPLNLEKPTTSVSLAPSGGLELLGKQRKESAGSGGPPRAERAGASESLGWGEGALRVQGNVFPHRP
jgi:hypothetical protein